MARVVEAVLTTEMPGLVPSINIGFEPTGTVLLLIGKVSPLMVLYCE
jgi:hypothetical protein